MADKKISQLNAVITLGNNDLFPVVQGAETKKAKISDIKSYLPTASSLNTGLLSNTDWTTFNNKQNALTLGNLTESTSSVLTITGGTGSIIGSGTTIQVKQASGSQSGFLSSTDWTTFNNKMTGLTLTTTGTSGAATYNSGTATLNIPQYLGAAVTSINGSTTAAQTIQTGSTGTDFTIGTVAGVTTVAIPTASASARGLLSTTDWSTFNGKQNALTIGNLTESTSSVLTITGGTGSVIGSGTTIQIKKATGSQDGYLASSDFTTFAGKQNAITLTTTGSSGAATFIGNVLNIPQYSGGGGGITTLNTLTAATQTFATGTTGSDFNISSATSTHTFNIPDAGASARGVVTTGTQTLAGSKTFSSAPTFSTMTAGSVLFAGTSGLLSQDNTNLFWDNTNKRLGIGTSSPAYSLDINGRLFVKGIVMPTLAVGGFGLIRGDANTSRLIFGFNDDSLNPNGSYFQSFGNNFSNVNSRGGTEFVFDNRNSGLGGFSIFETDGTSWTNRVKSWVGGNVTIGTTTNTGFRLDINGTCRHQGNTTFSDATNLILGTSTGNKIGTATSQKIGFWNATPIVQPTTAVAAATRVGGGGTTVTDTDTFDGYTIAQVVKALRNSGLLA